MNPEEAPQQIRRFMAAHNLKQGDVAELIKVRPNYISMVVSGKSKMSPMLCELLRVKIARRRGEPDRVMELILYLESLEIYDQHVLVPMINGIISGYKAIIKQ